MKDRLRRLKNPPTLIIPYEFHLWTEERALTHQGDQLKAKEHEQDKELKLTQAKSPAFETSERARPPRVKSAAELEEEMLAKIPKFKACPLPTKIWDSGTGQLKVILSKFEALQ
ncbi:hypothetical protein KC19_VG184500 [Ceratodon purpureus]|uniref:TPX2 central domain-containing protein n=1 Tax=Ceratodon purpureus TaxID=3225 RepID=A0A8T0HRX1_CERPU|nr:hypothetical protein KC19_VG184500 [Ceratodon purpureus]